MPRPTYLPRKHGRVGTHDAQHARLASRRQQQEQGQSSSSGKNSFQVDEYHNSDLPSCQLLHKAALQIFDTISSDGSGIATSSSSIPSFEELILEQIVEVYKQQCAESLDASEKRIASATTSGSKKKRKKKKKKSGKKNNTTDQMAVDPDDDDDENDDEEEVGRCAGKQDTPGVVPACAPPPSTASSSNTTPSGKQQQLGNPTGNGSSNSENRPGTGRVDATGRNTSTADVRLHPHWAMIQDFLRHQTIRYDSIVGSTDDKTKEYRRQKSISFWERLTSQLCTVPVDYVKSCVASIHCDTCRGEVERAFMVDTQFLLTTLPSTSTISNSNNKNSNSRRTTSTMCSSRDEEAFDYIAMEEGNAPPMFNNNKQKEKELASSKDLLTFAMSVSSLSGSCSTSSSSHDKNGGGASPMNCVDEVVSWNLRYVDPARIEEHLSARELASKVLIQYLLGRGLSYDDMVRIVSTQRCDAQQEEQEQLQQKSKAKNTTKVCTTSNSTEPSDLSASDAKRIMNIVDRDMVDFEKFFNQCAKQMQAIACNWASTRVPSNEHYHNTNGVDITAFSKIQEVDSECCELMIEKLFNVAWEMTQMYMTYNFRRHESDWPKCLEATDHEMKKCVLEIWNVFFNIVQTASHALVKFEESLKENVAGRNGVLPAPFFSPKFRDYYRALVQNKLACAHTMINELKTVMVRSVETGLPAWATLSSNASLLVLAGIPPAGLSGPLRANGNDKRDNTDCSTTFVRKLYTQRTYLEVISSISEKERSRNVEKDRQCYDFLKVICECVQTVHGAKISQIEADHASRHERMKRRLNAFFYDLAGANEAFEDISSSEQLHEMREKDFPLLTGTAYRYHIGEVGFKLMSYYINRGYSDAHPSLPQPKPPPSPQLPIQLLRSLTPPPPPQPRRPYQDFITEANGNKEGVDSYCCGGNGTERALCILMALYYHCMKEVWVDWRAEVAEQELLSSMEADDSLIQQRSVGSSAGVDPPSSKGVNKQNKKSKKKKDKRNDNSKPNKVSAEIDPEAVPMQIEGDDRLKKLAVNEDAGSEKLNPHTILLVDQNDNSAEQHITKIVSNVILESKEADMELDSTHIVETSIEVNKEEESHKTSTNGKKQNKLSEQLRNDKHMECEPTNKNKKTEQQYTDMEWEPTSVTERNELKRDAEEDWDMENTPIGNEGSNAENSFKANDTKGQFQSSPKGVELFVVDRAKAFIEIDACTDVGLYDQNNRFISAEEYLVERLFAVQEK